jgi:hypothetical protein
MSSSCKRDDAEDWVRIDYRGSSNVERQTKKSDENGTEIKQIEIDC